MGAILVAHLRRHVVGYLALMVALSGTAYALGRNSVDSRERAPDSVGASELDNNAVASSNVKNGSLGATDFDDDGYCGYVGQLLLVGFDYAPQGTLTANGRTLGVDGNQELFSLYGNQYGGDVNATPPTFGLPNIPGPVAGTQYVVCVNGVYPPRD